MDKEIPVKVYFGSEDVRRFSINHETSLNRFYLLCKAVNPSFFEEAVVLRYIDNEKEFVTLCTELEWRDALKYYGGDILRVQVLAMESNDTIESRRPKMLRKTPREKFVLACMRANPKPVPRQKKFVRNKGMTLEEFTEFFGMGKNASKVSKGIQVGRKFEYLKKTPSEKFILACMKKNKKPEKKVIQKPEKKKIRGMSFGALCAFLNLPRKVVLPDKVMEQKDLRYKTHLQVLQQMGLMDKKRNLELLKKFKGDLQSVVHALFE